MLIKTITYGRIPTNKCRKNDRFRKLPLGNHCSTNWLRQESTMDAETNGWKFVEDQDIYIVLEDLSQIIY